jgi:hypothetical protein
VLIGVLCCAYCCAVLCLLLCCAVLCLLLCCAVLCLLLCCAVLVAVQVVEKQLLQASFMNQLTGRVRKANPVMVLKYILYHQYGQSGSQAVRQSVSPSVIGGACDVCPSVSQ